MIPQRKLIELFVLLLLVRFGWYRFPSQHSQRRKKKEGSNRLIIIWTFQEGVKWNEMRSHLCTFPPSSLISHFLDPWLLQKETPLALDDRGEERQKRETGFPISFTWRRRRPTVLSAFPIREFIQNVFFASPWNPLRFAPTFVVAKSSTATDRPGLQPFFVIFTNFLSTEPPHHSSPERDSDNKNRIYGLNCERRASLWWNQLNRNIREIIICGELEGFG